MKKIVIFGATGNLGAYTAIDLKNHGYDVIAVGGRKSDNGFFSGKGILYLSVNLYDPRSFNILPQNNIYAVIHLAGELPSRYNYNPKKLLDSIIQGTFYVLDYMKKVGAKKIIFPQTPFDLYYLHNTKIPIKPDLTRTFPPIGDHSIYTIAKNAAVDLIEHYHAEFGFSRFILRFFTIYQFHPNPYHYGDTIRKKMPYRILMDRAMKGETIEIWGDPSKEKEIVYIKDFTQVVRKCIESHLEGGIYNVGGEKTISLEEQIKGIIDVFSPVDKKSDILYCSDKPDSLQASFDISKTKNELGYKPQYSYLDAMKDLYKEMHEQPFAELWGKSEDYE